MINKEKLEEIYAKIASKEEVLEHSSMKKIKSVDDEIKKAISSIENKHGMLQGELSGVQKSLIDKFKQIEDSVAKSLEGITGDTSTLVEKTSNSLSKEIARVYGEMGTLFKSMDSKMLDVDTILAQIKKEIEELFWNRTLNGSNNVQAVLNIKSNGSSVANNVTAINFTGGTVTANPDGSVTIPLASSPLTTKGDVYGFSTTNARIPIGNDTQVLTADSTQDLGVKWATPSSVPVSSVFGRTGAITAVSGDYNTLLVTENTNLYFTTARAISALTGQSNTIFSNGAGYITAASLPVAANPTALVGLTAVNGVATTFMRSDASPALDVTISPTWTGTHTFNTSSSNNVIINKTGHTNTNTIPGDLVWTLAQNDTADSKNSLFQLYHAYYPTQAFDVYSFQVSTGYNMLPGFPQIISSFGFGSAYGSAAVFLKGLGINFVNTSISIKESSFPAPNSLRFSIPTGGYFYVDANGAQDSFSYGETAEFQIRSDYFGKLILQSGRTYGGTILYPYATTDKALVLKGVASQTGDLLQAQNSSGTKLASIGSGGLITNRLTTKQQQWEYDASNYANITVGSTGGVILDAVGSGSAFQFNDKVTVPRGGASTFARVGGSIFDFFTNGTVGGAEADIFTATTDASLLSTNGDKLLAEYSGNFVTVGTQLTQLKVYFGGTAIWDSTGVAPTTGTTSWRVVVELIRVSATVVRYTVSLNTTGASGYVYCTAGELTGLTLTNTNILKITGTSSGVGSGSGDIVGKMGYINYQPYA